MLLCMVHIKTRCFLLTQEPAEELFLLFGVLEHPREMLAGIQKDGLV